MTSFRFTTLSAVLLLAMSAFAVQGSMQQPGQTPQQPGAASPSAQQPGSMPPSAAPQTPSESMPNSQAEPSQPPMRSGAPSIDDQVATLSQRLNLTSDQQTKIKSILEDQHQQAAAVVGDTSLSHDVKMQKILSLRETTIGKVRNTLTSDDQKQKFDAIVQAQSDRMHGGQQPQNSNPTPQSNNPTPK